MPLPAPPTQEQLQQYKDHILRQLDHALTQAFQEGCQVRLNIHRPAVSQGPDMSGNIITSPGNETQIFISILHPIPKAHSIQETH